MKVSGSERFAQLARDSVIVLASHDVIVPEVVVAAVLDRLVADRARIDQVPAERALDGIRLDTLVSLINPGTRPLRNLPDEQTAAREVADRLKADYPHVDPATVDTVVAHALDAFGQARIRAFVPVLVERRARAQLTATTDAHAADQKGTAGPSATTDLADHQARGLARVARAAHCLPDG